MEDPGDDSQPQGYYPRLNSKSLATGQYANMIVSMVGHFLPTPNPDGTIPFRASDGGIVSVTPEQVEMPLIGPDSPPFEVIGQALGPAGIFVRQVCVETALPRRCTDAPRRIGTVGIVASHDFPRTLQLLLASDLAVLHERAHEGHRLGGLRQDAGCANEP
jgi:hypothetical protein